MQPAPEFNKHLQDFNASFTLNMNCNARHFPKHSFILNVTCHLRYYWMIGTLFILCGKEHYHADNNTTIHRK